MGIRDLLKQYNELKKEIEELGCKIDKLKQEKIGIVSDSVKGSGGFPYNVRTFKIIGYDYEGLERKNRRIKRYIGILEERLDRCEKLTLEVEGFISSIPDSRTRRVFQYRYIDGLEWRTISRKFGKLDESYSRKIHERYLERL